MGEMPGIRRPLVAAWAWLPIAALAVVVGIAELAVPPALFYDPGWLLLVGNTLFVTVVGLVVASIALRTYRATGRVQLLLLGCGVLVFGIGAGLAAALRSLPDGANLNVTVYNVSACLSGCFHFAAAMTSLAAVSPGSERRDPSLLIGYAGSTLLVLLVTIASLQQVIPPFFVQGSGPTVLRQHVLGAADVLFAFSFVIFIATYRRNREAFLYWYSCALALTALSLTAFLMEKSVGSPVGWAGRFAQYVGGFYFLIALLTAVRSAEWRHTSLDNVLTSSLSGAEERFRALAENVPDLIRRFDREMRHVYVNPAALRVYGKPASTILGKSIEDSGLPEERCRVWRERIAKVLDTAQQLEVQEFLPTREGRRYYESRCVPEYAADGTVATALVISRDLTDHKLAEERLQESDRRKDEFLAVLSHELRGPLTPIRNSVLVLRDALPGGEQARRAQAIIDRQSAQLVRLVDDLLDLNRISRGRIELQRERVDVAELVRRTAEDHRASFQERGVRLEVALAAGPLWVDADPIRIAQVVGNLLGNASKFTARDGCVHVSAGAQGGRAVVRVRDTGAGIAHELLGKIFDPFTQAQQTIARSQGGLGLGLALVKGFVEMHGGQVAASSRGPGHGSEFVVELPLAPAAEPAAARTAVAAPARRLRVVLIEDNRDAAESLRDVIALMGHEAEYALDGASGLAMARARQPDLVLCDIGLPDMDGYAVARALRSDPALATCRLVALTGYAQPQDLANAERAGFDRHLAKPPSLESLGELLAAAAATK